MNSFNILNSVKYTTRRNCFPSDPLFVLTQTDKSYMRITIISVFDKGLTGL